MEKKLIIPFIALSLLVLMSISALAVSTPALVNTTWSPGGKINFSITQGNATTDLAVYMASASTANGSSAKRVINITNSTATNFMLGFANFTFSADIVLEDASDYTTTFMTTGTGDASASTGTTATDVKVSRTAPLAPTTTLASQTIAKNGQVFTYTVVGTKTTGCVISFAAPGQTPQFGGTNTFIMTHTGNTCVYTMTTGAVPNGNYDVFARASDQSDINISSAVNIQVATLASGGSAGAYVVQQQAQQAKSSNTGLIVAALLIAAVFVIKGKKKGR